MHVFLDFEASSLAKNSYPIEVAWVFEDGRSESYLILPAPGWTDWDDSAEAVHRISREALLADGTPHDVVARRMLETLSAHAVYASAPSWDGKWLSTLLRTAGLPRHAMRLKDTDEAQHQAVAEVLATVMTETELARASAAIIERAKASAGETVVHRALADAERERQIWLQVRRLAQEAAARRDR